MDKQEHADKLRAAIAQRPQVDRGVIADALNVNVRTVTNWTSGKTLPSDRERAGLRRLLGDYDSPGDPVEVAIRSSELTEDRQYAVIATYKRQLREQSEGLTG